MRVVQNRTADDVAQGKVCPASAYTPKPCSTNAIWALISGPLIAQPVQGINFIVLNPDGSGTKLIDGAARLDQSAYSVDQWLKIPRGMAEFSRLGG